LNLWNATSAVADVTWLTSSNGTNIITNNQSTYLPY
jgi:hypothetical protein